MTIKKGTSTIATNGATDWGSIEGTLSDQTDLQNALDAKAPSLSPALTGAPTAPTAPDGTNTTQIATTEFVTTALNNIDALPDQTDMAGKYLATDGTDAFWRSPSGLPLLSFLWSDHLLNDASFLRADTFSWQSGDVYKSVYEHLANDYVNRIIGDEGDQGDGWYKETINGQDVWYIKGPDGHKICVANNENAVQTIYNSTGVSWYYILDRANTRFKLPRTKFGFTGIRDNVGNYVEPGLPNITGGFLSRGFNGSGYGSIFSPSGAFTTQAKGASESVASVSITTVTNADVDNFDASRSSSIYGNSTTVQPPATQMYLYFYAGDTVRNQTEIDVGEITEALDGKLDQDLSNASANFKETIVNWGLPDMSAGVSKSTSGFTADENGWVQVRLIVNNHTVTVEIDSKTVMVAGTASQNNLDIANFFPIKKGSTLSILGTMQDGNIHFYPCIGA